MTRGRVCGGMLAIGLAIPAAAQTGPADDDLSSLLAVLSQETEVATRTRMNGDYVPGMVTVLEGEELEALGASTVWEALALVPGIQTMRDQTGAPSVIVRGLDFPFNSGNVKVLVDSVALSRESAGLNGIVLDLPLELVERIEVIRGPGSVLYGDFAFMGLVNVITRGEGARAWLRGSTHSAGGGGFQAAGGDPRRLRASLGAAGFRADDEFLPTNLAGNEDRQWGVLALERGGLTLRAGLARRRAEIEGRAEPEQVHWAVETRYARDLTKSLRAEVHASHLDNGFTGLPQSFEGSVSAIGLGLSGEVASGHTVLFALEDSFGRIGEARFAPPPAPPGAPPPGGLPVAFTVEDRRRDVLGLTAQDRWDVSDALAVTAGARYDRASDVGERLTPRLALVWRASDRNIVKAQYAEGFRAPTFFEYYAPANGATPPRYEVNGTAEVNAIHRRPRSVLRATAFRSEIRDMLFVVPGGRFGNRNHARTVGFELEGEHRLSDAWKAQANLSFVHTRHDRNAQREARETAPSADWMGNVTLTRRVGPHGAIAARWNHVGDRHTDEVAGYDLVDVTGTARDLFGRGLEVRAGVKNVFDSDVRYVVELPNAIQALAYQGRTAFLQVGWRR